MVIFSTLRRFTGGYHANTYLKCKIITMSVFLASLFFSNMLNANWWMYLILFIVGNIIVFFLAPIENPNKPLDGEDKKKFKRLSHMVFSVMIICGILFDVWLQMKTEILFFSLLSVLIMMIIPKFMKGAISNETKSCEKDC